MAGESGKEVHVAEKSDTPVAEEKTKEVIATKKKKKKQRGLISRIWHKLFGSRDDDFGMRLERISKDEAAILSRMKRRSHSWGKMRRNLILFSVLLELVASPPPSPLKRSLRRLFGFNNLPFVPIDSPTMCCYKTFLTAH